MRALGQIDPRRLAIADSLAVAGCVREARELAHSTEVGDLSFAIARALGLALEVQERALLGGLVHDVGKLMIPDQILAKPGPLTAEEWIVVRTHPAVGARIVAFLGLLPLVPAVRFHHERFDGHGYPDRLAGEEIPIEARIIAAADTYGALTNDRPYRRGISQHDALAELQRCASTQLDPRVVAALLDVVRHAP